MELRCFTWIMLCFGTLATFGCGGPEGEPTYPVTGTVTRNGQPLPGAIVSFFPETGTPAVGETDASGKYALTTNTKDDGAVVGKYKVTIQKYSQSADYGKVETAPSEVDITAEDYDEYPAGYDEMAESQKAAAVPRNLLPPKYENPETSGLTAEVVEGNNVHDFKVDG